MEYALPSSSSSSFSNGSGKISHPMSTRGIIDAANSSPKGDRTPQKRVHMHIDGDADVKENRERYLTAKYGAHQMSLIRKRLGVEMWMYEELQSLASTDNSLKDVEVDLDEVLDLDDDAERRKFVMDLLANAKSSPEAVNKFVDELLSRLKVL